MHRPSLADLPPVPDGWAVVPLANATELIKDGTHGSHERVDAGVPLLSAKNITESGVVEYGETDSRISRGDFCQIHRSYRLRAGDILLTIVGTLGRSAVLREDPDFTIQRSVAVIRPTSEIDSEYVGQYVRGRAFQSELQRRSSSTAQSGVYLGELAKIPLPVPPLPEQRKIAAILSSVDDAIAATRKVIEQSKRVKQGLLRTLMTRGIGHTRFKKTEIGEVPETWQVVRLGKLVSLHNGRAFKPAEWTHRGLPIIRIANLNGDRAYNHFNGEVDERHMVREGDLLFAWSGSRGTSFGPSVWQGPTGVLNQHIFKVVPKIAGVFLPFLHQKLQELTIAIEASAHGSAGLVHVRKADLVKYPLALPPLSEQKRVVGVLAAVDQVRRANEVSLDHATSLKRGLMQDLLTGRVRVQSD